MSNLDKIIPESEIEFDGEKKKLVFSTYAFCLLEEKTGKNALDAQVWINADLRTLSTIIWAGLQTHHPEITLDQVRTKLSVRELTGNLGAILEAFKKASPPEEDPTEEKKTE